MNDQVEQIKQKSDVVELIGQRVVLKKAGRHFKGLCPFHSEKSPSFIVSPERQSYKCFGCGEGGDVITFLQKYEGMSFLEAIEYLAKRVGIVLESYRPSAQDAQKKRLIEIMDLAGQYYRYVLNELPQGEAAKNYLSERGIGKAARDCFGLGYAPNGWRGICDYLIKKKGFTAKELVDVGLAVSGDKGYYDRFRGRIMFPLRDHKGVVVGFSGRELPGTNQGEMGAKYINSPETMLYSKGKMLYGLYENREAIRKADRLILVEGELDMIASWQAGVKEVAAIKGSAFTEEQARLIGRFTKNVAFALDADSAGQEAIKRAVKVADPYELSIRVVQVSGGKDPGEVAVEDPAKWREMVKQSVLFYDFVIESVIAKAKAGSEGIVMISREVVPVIAEISNLVVQAHYVTMLAKKLGIVETMIYEEIERWRKKKELKILSETVKQIESSPSNRREKLEKYVLAFILQYPELEKESLAESADELFGMRAIARVVRMIVEYKGPWKIENFVQTLPAELRPIVDESYLTDLSELGGLGQAKVEYQQALNELSQIVLKEGMKQLTPLIAAAEAEGNKEKLMELQDQFVRMSRKMQIVQSAK